MFNSENDKSKLSRVIKMKEVGLPKECVIIRHGNVKRAGGGWNGNNGLNHHLYLIPKDVDWKDTGLLAY